MTADRCNDRRSHAEIETLLNERKSTMTLLKNVCTTNLNEIYSELNRFTHRFFKLTFGASLTDRDPAFMQVSSVILDQEYSQIKVKFYDEQRDQSFLLYIRNADQIEIGNLSFDYTSIEYDLILNAQACDLFQAFINAETAAALSKHNRGFMRGKSVWATSEQEAFNL